jgi:chemotaxis methyl-accepting protein methylase
LGTAGAKLVSKPESEDLKNPAPLKIRDLLYKISGIYQPEEKLYLLASRCSRRMAAVNVKTPAEYLSHLTTRANREAGLRSLLNEITIAETYKFRSPPQLEALRTVILPPS